MTYHTHTITPQRDGQKPYARSVALITALTIVTYHVSTVYHVAWAIPASLIGWLGVAVWMRDRITALLIVIAMAPLELATIATVGGFDVRLFHVAMLVGVAVMVVCVVRDGVGRAWTGLRRRWTLADTALVLMGGVSVTTSLLAPDYHTAMMQTVVFGVCGVLYMLARFFVRSVKDALRVVPAIVASGVVISFYAIVQNIFFHNGVPSAEVMPGRPNALLSEPDWLGVYLVMVYAVALVRLHVLFIQPHGAWRKRVWVYGALVIIVTAAVITAARSAWLGVMAVSALYAMALAMRGAWDLIARYVMVGCGVALCVVGIVYYGQLTRFGLADRMRSTGTGQQEITVSCRDAAQAEQLVRQGFVAHVDDLAQYDCRHIKLEEIAQEDADGNSVIRVARADPNITLRKDIYTKTVAAIRAHPWRGYGWGASATLLGTDERNTPLNTSNIFLEIAFSIGVAGLVFYGILIGTIGVMGVVRWTRRSAADPSVPSAGLMALLAICAIVVPNMFNAGVFLAMPWVLMGIVAVVTQRMPSPARASLTHLTHTTHHVL